MESSIKTIVFCLVLTIAFQLILAVSLSEQSELNRIHDMSSLEDSDKDPFRRLQDGERQPHNRLSLSPQMLYLLIKVNIYYKNLCLFSN